TGLNINKCPIVNVIKKIKIIERNIALPST
ncbi:unnamed protein product, partial [marine sediment metagenome]